MTESAAVPGPEFYNREDSDNVCFLCRRPRYEPLYEVTHYGFPFAFQRCQCGLVKQTPLPNEQFFEWFFNSDLFFSAKQQERDDIWGYYDYFADESSRMATSRRRYHKLRQVFDVGRPLDIMKIGPSTGTFLHVAQEHGHHVRGCDISSQFAAYAREHYGVPIDQGRFERKDYADGQFDVLLLLNVIENVPNLEEFLRAIQRTVKVGGYFILNFVDMHRNVVAALQKERYFLYRPPVCYIFDSRTLHRTLDAFGFAARDTLRDIRHMHMEKILTLLGVRWPLALLRPLRLHRIPFPIYAYPSRIVVAQRVR